VPASFIALATSPPKKKAEAAMAAPTTAKIKAYSAAEAPRLS
jgi:hypothetical protein